MRAASALVPTLFFEIGVPLAQPAAGGNQT
jgi:hypothetical protein